MALCGSKMTQNGVARLDVCCEMIVDYTLEKGA
jgi:hypothetical protein